jgi:hypothetical protein
VTTWINPSETGRDRGVRGLLKTYVSILISPKQFFDSAVVPGDQVPGLIFGVVIALGYTVGIVLVTVSAPPTVAQPEVLASVILLMAVGLIIGPITLHLAAAFQTVLLIGLAPDRGGVSETVQLIAYASAPCLFAFIQVPIIRLMTCAYAWSLLLVGIRSVHSTSRLRAIAAGGPTGALLYGGLFRGFDAFEMLLTTNGII